ncbi:MAG: futalosine hydrolase [Bacteroidetes bacterium]|nr:futalosine hydrolase [Bacteroidota bacterium]
MNCLVVAATHYEIAPLVQQLQRGNAMPGTDILITGIGLTATTYALCRQLRIKRPDIIIQAGVGGCFDPSIPLGTVLAIKKEAFADQAVVEKKELKTLFDLRLASPNQYPFTRGWLVNKSEALTKLSLKKVTGVSVNEITTSKQKLKQYQEKYDPVVESMEGAALHYVCLMEKIPFMQIRAVSNYVTERNKKKWDLKGSIHQLNAELFKLLNAL